MVEARRWALGHHLMEGKKVVEKSYTSPGGNTSEWLPAMLDPLRTFGNRLAEFFTPNADAAITKDAYEVTVELPGVAEDDIELTLHDRVLSVKGEKRSEHKEEGKSYYFSERSYGAFQRSFRLPEDADPKAIDAGFKDGVLTVKIAKTAPAKDEKKKIKINA